MKILITGASGFIGKNLLKKLSPFHEVTGLFFNNRPGFSNNFIKMDITKKNQVENIIKQIKPDMVFHLAYSRKNSEKTIIQGSENLVNALDKFSKNSKLIFLSTDCVFSGKNPPYDEKSTPCPIDEYGTAKFEAEKIVSGFNAMIVRTSLVYGIKDQDENLKSLLMALKENSFNFRYFTDELRSCVYIDDLTDTLADLINFYDEFKLLHIHGPEILSRYSLAVFLSEIFGFDPLKIPFCRQCESGLARPLDLSFNSLYLSRLKKDFKTTKELKLFYNKNRNLLPKI